MAFNFQAYRNPYVSTIAELLSRGEDAKAKALIDVANAQARAAEARGQAYGGAIESVGKIVSGIPAQIQAGKDQAFQKAQRERLIVQQARDDAATSRLDQSRIAADRFRSNPDATTVIPGQAGSLPDRMLPSFSPDTFVPDGAATSQDTLGGMLRKANVFGQQPSSQRLADTIPSASMSGVAAVAPRLAATMTGPDTTTTTNTSTRRDENGLDLWDVEGYKQQEAAAGRGAEAQVTAKAMIESNDEMVKHYASAVALMQGDARRLSNQPDALLETGIDQLIERYRKNAVLPQEQLDAAAQQVDAIKQLPQEQQSLARRKFLQSVSGAPVAEDFTLGENGKRYSGTGALIAENQAPPEKPKLYQVTVAGPGGQPVTKLVTEEQAQAGVPVFREPKTPSAVGLRFLTGPKGDVIEWPTTTPAPPGYKPYDAVAERKGGAQDGQYSIERERRVLSSIDELLPKVGEFTTGFGSMLSGIPRSDARAFAAELATLKANIAFNELAAMRAASLTGGALGNVSNVELELLESTLGALDAGQAPAQVTAQLNKIRDSIVRWQTARNLQPKAGDNEVRITNQSGSGDAEADALIAIANAARIAREKR